MEYFHKGHWPGLLGYSLIAKGVSGQGGAGACRGLEQKCITQTCSGSLQTCYGGGGKVKSLLGAISPPTIKFYEPAL